MKILLAGVSKSGKDTCWRMCPGWYRAAFADPLKRMATQMIKCTGMHVTIGDWLLPEFKERWRPLLVALGAGMRATQPNFWINELIKDLVKKEISKQDDVVITDGRYVNEIQWVLDQGGTVIRLHRPGYGPANEEEARSFTDIDAHFPNLPVILNDGTEEDLGKKMLPFILPRRD